MMINEKNDLMEAINLVLLSEEKETGYSNYGTGVVEADPVDTFNPNGEVEDSSSVSKKPKLNGIDVIVPKDDYYKNQIGKIIQIIPDTENEWVDIRFEDGENISKNIKDPDDPVIIANTDNNKIKLGNELCKNSANKPIDITVFDLDVSSPDDIEDIAFPDAKRVDMPNLDRDQPEAGMTPAPDPSDFEDEDNGETEVKDIQLNSADLGDISLAIMENKTIVNECDCNKDKKNCDCEKDDSKPSNKRSFMKKAEKEPSLEDKMKEAKNKGFWHKK